MTTGIILYSAIPGWPSPADGLSACAEDAGVSWSWGPDGVLTNDVVAATAFAATFVGSEVQLSWNKNAKSKLLDAAFVSKIAAGRSYNGKLYQIDPQSTANINAMASLAMAVLGGVPGAAWPQGFYWIAADNSHTTMTAAEMFAFAQNIADYVSRLVLINRAFKDAIAAAPDMATLNAIDTTAGWPSNP